MQTITIQVPLDDLVNAIVERLSPALTPAKEPEEEYLSKTQVANRIGITVRTLTAHVKQGRIKAYRIGRRVLFKVDEVDNALKQIKVM